MIETQNSFAKKFPIQTNWSALELAIKKFATNDLEVSKLQTRHSWYKTSVENNIQITYLLRCRQIMKKKPTNFPDKKLKEKLAKTTFLSLGFSWNIY